MAAPDTRREVTLQADNFEVSVGDDDEHRGVKLGIDNEPFWRVWLTPQGEILTGNGLSPPTAYAGGGGGGGDVATDTIWDAAGDLAVGSGADTAARLAKGADGTVLSVVAGAVAWAAPAAPTGGAGGVLSGSYPSPGFAVDMATQGELDAETTARGVAIAALSAVYQPLHANLTAFAGLSLVADRLPYANGTGTLALATFTAAGRALVDDADAAAQRTTLGLGTMAVAAATDYVAKAGDTMTGELVLTRTNGTDIALTSRRVADAQPRWQVTADGFMAWDNGTDATPDANYIDASTGGTFTFGGFGTSQNRPYWSLTGSSDTGRFLYGYVSSSPVFQMEVGGGTTTPHKIYGTATWTEGIQFPSQAIGQLPLSIKGFAGQTRNLFEVQNSAATILIRVSAGGTLTSGGGAAFGATSAGGSTHFLLAPTNAGDVGLKVLGFTSQTADLTQWQSPSGVTVASVSAVGLGLFAGLSITDAKDITFGTTTGTKIGTGATQKIGYWGATPVVQPVAVADATGGTVIDTEARAAINALLARLRTPGIIAT